MNKYKIGFLITSLFIIFSFSNNDKESDIKFSLRTIEHEGCEYVTPNYPIEGGLTHKGVCKNPKHKQAVCK